MGVKRRADVLCVVVSRKGRTGEGRCFYVGPELAGEARKTTGKNPGESQFVSK